MTIDSFNYNLKSVSEQKEPLKDKPSAEQQMYDAIHGLLSGRSETYVSINSANKVVEAVSRMIDEKIKKATQETEK